MLTDFERQVIEKAEQMMADCACEDHDCGTTRSAGVQLADYLRDRVPDADDESIAKVLLSVAVILSPTAPAHVIGLFTYAAAELTRLDRDIAAGKGPEASPQGGNE